MRPPGVHDFVRRRFVELRAERGLSVRAFAKQLGVVPELIGRLEKGDRDASLDTIDRACDALKITLSEFFDEVKPLVSPDAATRRRLEGLLGQLDSRARDNVIAALDEMISAVDAGVRRKQGGREQGTRRPRR